jgi:hypothetical protein
MLRPMQVKEIRDQAFFVHAVRESDAEGVHANSAVLGCPVNRVIARRTLAFNSPRIDHQFRVVTHIEIEGSSNHSVIVSAKEDAAAAFCELSRGNRRKEADYRDRKVMFHEFG